MTGVVPSNRIGTPGTGAPTRASPRRAGALGIRRGGVVAGACGVLLVAFAVAGCGKETMTRTASRAEQRNVAGRFAAALLRGDARRAGDLLVRDDDGSRRFLVAQAIASWKSTQQVSIKPPSRVGNRWTFSYVRRRTQRDGRFQTENGDLVVIVGSSAAAAGVEFFAFRYVRTRFSTHHDSQLLPSNR